MPSNTRPAPRVLVVEDASSLRRMMCDYLRVNGFEPIEAWSIEGAQRALETRAPDLVLLDIMLDDGEGYDLLQSITALSLPLMVVSAKASALDRILCLELGADDYLVKPFELRELLLRLRRLKKLSALADSTRGRTNTLRIGRVAVDLVDRMVSHPGRDDMRLTDAEFRLLRMLVDHPGKALDRRTIAAEVFRREAADDSRRVDVLVSKLRRKIHDDDGPSVIVNIRNMGYFFQPRDTRPAHSQRPDTEPQDRFPQDRFPQDLRSQDLQPQDLAPPGSTGGAEAGGAR